MNTFVQLLKLFFFSSLFSVTISRYNISLSRQNKSSLTKEKKCSLSFRLYYAWWNSMQDQLIYGYNNASVLKLTSSKLHLTSTKRFFAQVHCNTHYCLISNILYSNSRSCHHLQRMPTNVIIGKKNHYRYVSIWKEWISNLARRIIVSNSYLQVSVYQPISPPGISFAFS